MKIGDKVLCINVIGSQMISPSGVIVRTQLQAILYKIREIRHKYFEDGTDGIYLEGIENPLVTFEEDGITQELYYGANRFMPYNTNAIEEEHEEEYFVLIPNTL